MWIVTLLSLVATQSLGEFHWPSALEGWMGLLGLCIFYSSGITLMFTVLPKLGVVGNSAILNLEPIFALVRWLVYFVSIHLLISNAGSVHCRWGGDSLGHEKKLNPTKVYEVECDELKT
jgi:hypothetical protein